MDNYVIFAMNFAVKRKNVFNHAHGLEKNETKHLKRPPCLHLERRSDFAVCRRKKTNQTFFNRNHDEIIATTGVTIRREGGKPGNM